MGKSDKPKRGRPPMKPDAKMIPVLIAFPAELLEQIDARAEDDFETRAAMIRRLIVRGLKAKG
jgi:metal-responsive CopG/Arc/MetJ family transcriptional regulator